MKLLDRQQGASETILGDSRFDYEAYSFLLGKRRPNFDSLTLLLRECFPVDRRRPERGNTEKVVRRSSETASREGFDYTRARLLGPSIGKRASVTEHSFVDGWEVCHGGSFGDRHVRPALERRYVTESHQRRVAWKIAVDQPSTERGSQSAYAMGLNYNTPVDNRLASALDCRKAGIWARGDILTAFVACANWGDPGSRLTPALTALGTRMVGIIVGHERLWRDEADFVAHTRDELYRLTGVWR